MIKSNFRGFIYFEGLWKIVLNTITNIFVLGILC